MRHIFGDSFSDFFTKLAKICRFTITTIYDNYYLRLLLYTITTIYRDFKPLPNSKYVVILGNPDSTQTEDYYLYVYDLVEKAIVQSTELVGQTFSTVRDQWSISQKKIASVKVVVRYWQKNTEASAVGSLKYIKISNHTDSLKI